MLEDVIYGVHAVEEFVSSYPDRVNKVLLATNRPQLEKLLKLHRVPFQKVPLAKIEELCKGSNHQGVIALVSPIPYLSLEDLSSDERLVLALDGIEDPQNLGAILRTAEAVGIKSVVIPSRRSSPITPSVIKASSGAAVRLKVIRVNSMVTAIRQLKDMGFWIIGSDVEAGNEYSVVDYPFPAVLVLGSEGKGMHRTIRALCDMIVYIPIYGKVQSLNVSVAAGILLYEIAKRLRAKPA